MSEDSLPTAVSHPMKLSLVQNANLNSQSLELSGELKSIEFHDRPSLKKHYLQPFDLLVTIRFRSFWCALVPDSPPLSIASGGICVLRQIDPSVTSSHYIASYLRSQAGIKAVAIHSHPVQTSAPAYQGWFSLSRQELLKVEIPIPSLLEQHHAITAFEAIDSLRQRHQSQLQTQIEQFNQLFS
jgi:restriction endonuclease S subunit